VPTSYQPEVKAACLRKHAALCLKKETTHLTVMVTVEYELSSGLVPKYYYSFAAFSPGSGIRLLDTRTARPAFSSSLASGEFEKIVSIKDN
jgi:hypothetical protein